MKVLFINSVCGIGSTGRICTDLAQQLEAEGNEVKIAYGRNGTVPEQFQKYAVRIGSEWDVRFHGMKARLFDAMGLGSREATQKFIKWVEEFNPDIIHLHNIHGYYINIEILFKYLKTCGKKITWTLHDCWAFTGHCAYFDFYGCNKWISGCKGICVCKKDYPASFLLSRAEQNYQIKKSLFTGINNLTIVTPSQWLASLVKKSFLSEYNVKVIHNGVNTDVFKPTPSEIKSIYSIGNKKIILGVASIWDRRKGLETFIELSKQIEDDYKIILIGLNKEQIKKLPNTIIGIERTNSTKELAEFYSVADVFLNPTLEDNYPTTNIEAIACGTPVISYDTGGSGESAIFYGSVVKKGDITAIIQEIKRNEFKKQECYIDYRLSVKKYCELYLCQN